AEAHVIDSLASAMSMMPLVASVADRVRLTLMVPVTLAPPFTCTVPVFGMVPSRVTCAVDVGDTHNAPSRYLALMTLTLSPALKVTDRFVFMACQPLATQLSFEPPTMSPQRHTWVAPVAPRFAVMPVTVV